MWLGKSKLTNKDCLKNRIIMNFNISKKNNAKELVMQFVKFGLVGALNTLIAWAVYYLFLWMNEKLYMIGSVVGGILSIANAFFWNDKFVFKGKQNDIISKIKRLGKTYISYSGTSLLGMVLLWVEVELFNLNKAFAPPINLIITIPLNFVINKLWTFRDKENIN